jgi:hypothetical protein
MYPMRGAQSALAESNDSGADDRLILEDIDAARKGRPALSAATSAPVQSVPRD